MEKCLLHVLFIKEAKYILNNVSCVELERLQSRSQTPSTGHLTPVKV